jgi:hypothetical protein
MVARLKVTCWNKRDVQLGPLFQNILQSDTHVAVEGHLLDRHVAQIVDGFLHGQYTGCGQWIVHKTHSVLLEFGLRIK